MTHARMTGAELAGARRFIGAHTWTFARTVADHPHWYLLCSRVTDREALMAFKALVDRYGRREKWPIPGTVPQRYVAYRYLLVDGMEYWFAGHHGSWQCCRRQPGVR